MKRTKTNHPKTILTNDPSMTGWGWAVISLSGQIIDSGCIKTSPDNKKSRIRKGDQTTRRISEINQILLSLIHKYNVTYIISELPHGSQNASAAVMIGVVAGITQTIADSLKIGIEWYSEGDAKKHLLGKQSAAKNEIIQAINKIYTVPWTGKKYIDEAVADSLAIYHVATANSPTLKYFKMSLT